MPAANKKSARLTDCAAEPASRWPWRRLSVDKNTTSPEGRARVQLSPHIINLRPSATLEPSKRKITTSTAESTAETTINFVSAPQLASYALARLVELGIKRWPWLGDLTLILFIEISAAVADIFWLPALTFFIRLYQETSAIYQSVWLDIQTFAGVIYNVVSWPMKASRLMGRPSLTVRPLRFPLKVLLAQSGTFFVLALILILPIKSVATWQNLTVRSNQVMNLASSGFYGLEQAGALLTQGNAALAQQQLAAAQQSFSEALQMVTDLSNELSGLLGRLPLAAAKLNAAHHVLSASQEITQAASIAATTLNSLTQVDIQASPNFGADLNVLSQAATDLQPHLTAASQHLRQVEPTELPPELAPLLTDARSQLNDLEVNLAQVLALPQLLQQMMASTEPKTYVVLFQNNSELRPTGGFFGSLALIEVAQGEVRSVKIPGGGPYDWQGSLSQLIRPPEPLRLVRGTWQLQDANWFFDFPTSARKVIWFLKQSGGPAVKGVLALNSTVVVELLRLTGPIELPQYGKVLTADNFMSETQSAVEIDYDRAENRPKQFIADLAPILFSRLLQLHGEELIKLSSLVNASLLSRAIQLYSDEESVQSQFVNYGWAGEVPTVAADYLAIVRTNIGGGKTDGVIKEQIQHRLEISPAGELTAHLTIKRTHQGDPLDTFKGRRNVTYLRFYVPKGAALLSTQGFTPPATTYYHEVPTGAENDIDLSLIEQEESWHASSGTRLTTEYDKTVFGNWLSVSAGETKTAEISYRLPFRLKSDTSWQDLRRYSILFQRQSGVGPIDFSSEISWPENFRLRWQETSPQSTVDHNRLKFRSDWQSDEFYGIILEKV